MGTLRRLTGCEWINRFGHCPDRLVLSAGKTGEKPLGGLA
jgi:hypothetical protein